MLVREDDRVTKMRASQPQPPPRRAADFSRPPEVPFVSFDSCLPQQPKSKAIDKASLLPPLEKHLPIMSALASKPGASSFRHAQALPGSAVSVSKAPLSSYRSVHSALAELRPQEGLECLYGGAAAGGSSARVSPSVEWSSSGVVLEQFGAAREQFASRIISIPSSSSACANATASGEQAIPNLSLHHSIHKSGPWTPVEISLSGDNAISSSTFNMAPQTGPSAVAATVVSQQANPTQSFHHNLLKAGLWQPSLSPGDGTIIRQLSTGSYTESLLSSDLPTSTLSPTVSLSTSESTLLGGYCEEASKEDAAKLAKVNDTSSQSWAQQTEQRYNLQLALALRLVATAELAEEPYLIANSKENRLSSCAAQCSATSTALRFWVNGSLGYSDKIQDGFYYIWGMNPHIWAICNDTKEGGHLPSLEVLRRVNPSDTSIEVVLFDKHGDSHLLDLENKARKLANKVASLNELAESLGKLICGLMGGAATLEDGELVSRWRASSNLLKDCFSCLVIPVGSLSVGLCRHRALLYKALADYVDLPCRIVRGCKYCGLSEGTSCLVLCGTEREWLVDLISKPGELSNAELFLKSLQSPPINSPLRLPDLKVAEMATGLQKAEVDFVMQLSDITQLGSLDARNLRDMLGVPLPFNGPVSARLGNVWPVISSSEMECKSSSVKLTKPDFQIGHKRPPIEGRNMSRVSEAPAPAAADMFVFERDLVWNKPVSGSEDGPYNIDNNNNKNITVKDQNPPDIGKIYLDDSLKKALPEKDAKEVDEDGIRKQAQSLNISLELDGFEIPWEDLILRERIGAGSFGTVHRADWHGSDVAVKILIEQDIQEQHLQEFVREVALMKRMRHPNVVLFMGAVTKRPNFSIVTEFLPRGSLFRLLHKVGVKESLDEKRRIRMALDVARGMNYLHRLTPPIVHRDLKSPNLLVDKTWTVKVCDFGLSRFKGNTFLSSRSAAGTPEWMAPEVLRDEPSNEKSDVYSFGVILWELVTLQQPWNGLNAAQVVGAVGFQNRRLQIPKDTNPEISVLIEACFSDDPRQRPSFASIMELLVKIIQKLSATAGAVNA